MAKILAMASTDIKDIDDELKALAKLQSAINERTEALSGLWRKLRERAKTDKAVELAMYTLVAGSPMTKRPASDFGEEFLEALDEAVDYLHAEIESDFKSAREVVAEASA